MSGNENSKTVVVDRLLVSIKEISGLPECRNVFKTIYGNLTRRVKLLSPLFEEIKDGDCELLSDEHIRSFESLENALDSAKSLLKFVTQGSKLHRALQRNEMAEKFQQINDRIEAAVSVLPYEKLEISEEVREQIELVHSQFKRANVRTELADFQLDSDLAVAQKEKDPDPEILHRLSEKLHLKTMNDLKKESTELHELVITSGGEPGDSIELMSSLLKRLKNCVLNENPEVDPREGKKISMKHRSPVIPDDFRCPISLELMKDPVIVSTGQTYERSCIQKWLDAGNKTCPKTQQTLLHTALTPNYALKSLIALWCENNGVELPKSQGSCKTKKSGSSLSDCDRVAINALLDRLANGDMEQQRAAAGELRLLAKRNVDNRVCIAEAGAIPLLVALQSSADPQTQAGTKKSGDRVAINALLDRQANGDLKKQRTAAGELLLLAKRNVDNRVCIAEAGAMPLLVELSSSADPQTINALLNRLANGDLEQQRAAAGKLRLLAKRNADNRVCIAEAGAIPLLVELLSSADPRTQEHAVTALLNLSINESNKGTIVNAGAIPYIIEVLKNGSMEARENAAATLFSLSVLDENKVAIGAAGAIPALISLLCEGTPRGKKDAATAIFNLSIYQRNKARAVKAGIVAPLMTFLVDTGGGVVDEALAILAILANHPEGRTAIGQAEPIPILVEVIQTGSPRNRENAAAALWSLCMGDLLQLKLARDLGAEEALRELSENGTDRAKRKAGSILELLQRMEEDDNLPKWKRMIICPCLNLKFLHD